MPKKNPRTTTEPTTLNEAVKFFANPDIAFEYVKSRRFPSGVKCPTCGSEAVLFLKNQKRWKCSNDHAKRQFSVKVGTIMEDSPIALEKWVQAIWMVANCKNGISSLELHRAIDVTQKSAWFMLHRIRLAMQKAQGGGLLGGTVEVDETFIGGLSRNMHKSQREKKIKGTGGAGKAVVMGVLERHNRERGHSVVRAKVIPNTRRENVQTEVRAQVERGSYVMTDEWVSYRGLDPDYVHGVINHAVEYVRGEVHTNGIENFWSLLKRSIKGTYVSVEPYHLFRYVDEQAFRFNLRKHDLGDRGRFIEVLNAVAGQRLTYKQLTGKERDAASEAAPC